MLTVPHPLGGVDPEVIRAHARDAVDDLVAVITGTRAQRMATASFERLERLGTHDEATLCRVIDLEGELRGRIASSGDAADGLRSFVAAASDFRDALDRYSVINLAEMVESRRRTTARGTTPRAVRVSRPGCGAVSSR